MTTKHMAAAPKNCTTVASNNGSHTNGEKWLGAEETVMVCSSCELYGKWDKMFEVWHFMPKRWVVRACFSEGFDCEVLIKVDLLHFCSRFYLSAGTFALGVILMVLAALSSKGIESI